MSTTRRHHFIPVFYLKQFTDKNGFFYIYDVKKGKFKNNGQRFAPSTHFYQKFGNTVFNGLTSTDFLEKSYSNVDAKVGAIINKINTVKDWKLAASEWTFLQYFINILYWRNPSNEDKVVDYVRNAKNLSAFHMKLIDNRTGIRQSDEEERKLMSHPDFYKFAKYKLPGVTYPEIFKKEVQDSVSVFTLPPFKVPRMVSDNPIIYKRPGKESLHTDEFVFPLTPDKILFRHNFKELAIHSYVRIYIDMIGLMQAKEYISCTDLNYPVMLRQHCEKHYTSVDQVREKLFKLIFEKLPEL